LVSVIVIRILKTLNWNDSHIVLCNAGKFVLRGSTLNEDQQKLVNFIHKEIDEWLMSETRAELKFFLAIDTKSSNEVESYSKVMKKLDREKRQAWKNTVISESQWQVEKLVLKALGHPCQICHRGEAKFEDDDDGTISRVCARCHDDREIGKKLPSAKWAVVSDNQLDKSFSICGSHVTFLTTESNINQTDSLISLEGKQNNLQHKSIFLSRRLARHIPTANNQPIEFVELAEKSTGDKLLGVLKMDGDKMGLHISKLLQNETQLKPLKNFSEECDRFFSQVINSKTESTFKDSIYTVFSGGDDLLLVGSWDILLDFAGNIQSRFFKQFNTRSLSLSGGFALIKPKRPIKFAVMKAEELLEDAKQISGLDAILKTETKSEGRDQIAAFGQIWKWKNHKKIVDSAKQLTKWISSGVMERGWLYTLLRLAEMRQNSSEEAIATARLAYHVARNYPTLKDQNLQKVELRQWANRIIKDFDSLKNIETQYLPAITRYALTATRTREEKSND
ncbi:MAG: type III-A CRISPR-associated protein Cas10/Csm1, partial [Blastocatellia bacterium]|nr:type III-A CRISPR-associated protein Cas10/Csm1 [Blastocatellia bacterium]